MLLGEIIKMAFGSLGVNKLRSALTMAGITIGVFSVIGVMTTVSALRGSIESGLSFLGSDMFQFAKFPTGIAFIPELAALQLVPPSVVLNTPLP